MAEGEKSKKDAADLVVKAAFGAKNRSRLIDMYFASRAAEEVNVSQASEHVYRMLLWADQSNGLAHCYESDKSQPGKNWYARSLAFHDWVSSSLAVPPAHLAEEIDWLFRKATADLALEVMRKAQRVAEAAEKQRQPYDGRNFPKPGEDPELVAIVKEVLGDHLATEPPPEKWQLFVQRIRQFLAVENKRKNLVGEGFEDVIAQVVRRTCPSFDVQPRRLLHEIPGFDRPARQTDKPTKVDLVIIRPRMRTLVTAKWSVRADREKQFAADFGDYVSAERDGNPFEYVCVTNEFDPARLMRSCDKLAMNAHMFTQVVHINTDAIKATYQPAAPKKPPREQESVQKVLAHIDKGRLISLERWLGTLTA